MKNAEQSDATVSKLEYLSEMIGELRHLAIESGSEDLGHILEVAMLEAQLQLELGKRLQRV